MANKNFLIAVDPGRDKTGVAVLSMNGNIKRHFIIESAKLTETAQNLLSEYKANLIVIGSGTSGKAKAKMLRENFPSAKIETVNEYRSTDEARKLYFEQNPPKGWKRLIPLGMQTPPVPVDDYAAVVIGRKYLAQTNA